MRLLHISDWHLGRMTLNCSRIADHEAVLSETVEIARHAKPDLVIHTGDVFDGPRPAYEEVSRAVETLQRLAELAPVVVIAGNHDSPALFRLLGKVQGRGRITFVDKPVHPSLGGVLEFPGAEGELVRLAPIPFVHQNRMLDHFFDASKWSSDYADNMGLILSAYDQALAESFDGRRYVLLLASHVFVSGAKFSGSERMIHTSESYAARLDHLPKVSYAAFGHIHRPQALPGTKVAGRYAGSPIPLDFGELGEQKSVVLVEATPGRPAKVETVALSGGRPLARFQGTLEELATMGADAPSCLATVTVNAQEPILELSEKVRALFPERVVLLDVQPTYSSEKLTVLSEADARACGVEPTLLELLAEFLDAKKRRTTATSPAKILEVFATLNEAIDADLEPVFEEASSLLPPNAGQRQEVEA